MRPTTCSKTTGKCFAHGMNMVYATVPPILRTRRSRTVVKEIDNGKIPGLGPSAWGQCHGHCLFECCTVPITVCTSIGLAISGVLRLALSYALRVVEVKRTILCVIA